MAKHILLVEDNRDDADLAVRSLQKAGITADVVVARDGAEALNYLSGNGSQLPAVVFLDLKLPKVGGLEVLRKIRANEETRLLPVVMFTSSGEARDLEQCYESGASSYVKKPVDFEDFAKTTQQLAFYWLSINEPSP